MAEILITNDGKINRYVGSICVLPGETKIIDERLVHAPRQQPAREPDQIEASDMVSELLAGKVADIVAALPDLAEDDFVRLAKLEEESEKPRASLMKAIVAEGIRRAGQKLDEKTEGDE